jgi:diguanylate cyclase (GGDEF)-like protein
MMMTLIDETSAISRNVFRYLLESEEKRALRYEYFFSLLSMAIDQNENLGELKELVHLTRKTIRTTDLIGRINHSRILVILYQSEGSHAMDIGERIRSKVEQTDFDQVDGSVKRTISIGGACFPTHFANIDDLIFTAHEMGLVARSQGGNKVLLPGMATAS